MSATQVVVVAVAFGVGYLAVGWLLKDRGGQAAGPGAEAPSKASWYGILGVDSEASVEEIRSAYREQMDKYRPDKVAGLGPEFADIAARKSKEIEAAFRQAQWLRGFSA